MNASCPSKAQLESYVSGRLDGQAHGVIDDHVDACVTCQAALETLDDLAEASFACLRAGGGPAPAESLEVGPLAARAKALHAPLNGAHENQGELVLSNARTAYQTEEVNAGRGDSLVLGNYVLLEPLGAGGMGRVFKAYHRRMKRVVAVKLLAPDLLRSETGRLRFQREIEAVARLAHVNIVAAHDADEADGRHFLVMEFVEGSNLSELVKREGPLGPERALACILQAARGLEHAHAAGIVHRDVKPANLLVTPQGIVKVLDLGLARFAAGDSEPSARELTTTGVVMGTAAFMAPEQALDTHQADHRADVYSLGCCLYYLLTGKPPFTGETPMAVLFAHREQPAPCLGEAYPMRLEAIFQKMVAKRPEERHASMRELAEDLERLQADLPTLLPPAPARRSRRRTIRIVAAAVTAVAASIALAVALSGSPQPQGEEVPPPDSTEKPVAVLTPSKTPAPTPATPAIEMQTIPAGIFWMGSPTTDAAARGDERPRHRVAITQPLQLGKDKITQAQFEAVMGRNPSAFRAGGHHANKVAGIDTKQHPVESISWEEAIAFCNALSKVHGLPLYYKIDDGRISVRGGSGYRLPTEAEWEYACRAGAETRWPFGDDPASLDRFAWYAANSGGSTHPVGQKAANALGLRDMLGNVPEWCWDRYDENYYKDSPVSDPPGSGKGDTRVYRGGGWNVAAAGTRPAARHTLGTAYAVLTIVGLRVARNATP